MRGSVSTHSESKDLEELEKWVHTVRKCGYTQ